MTEPRDDRHGTARTVHTFCRYCMATCGIDVAVDGNQVVKISPDRENPHSWSDFCAKGRTANQVVEHPRRILHPMRRVGEVYVEATWDEAIADIARRMNALIDADGPDAIGFYFGNPVAFSSSNYVFLNGLMDAIGTHSRYSAGSVDQNALHVVADAMYGSPFIIPVSDVDNCDYFLLVGTNPAVSAWNWFETVPGGWRRALERQRQGATIVVVDPVRTESADKADVHLAVRPGQDWALLLAMVKVILDEGLQHQQDCAAIVSGNSALRELVSEADLDDLAARCEIDRGTIERVARQFAVARSAMVVTRTGISLHTSGTVGEWLGNVLNVITGRMDRPGGRRYERGIVDGTRLIELRKPKPHDSRIAGRGMIVGAHAVCELPDEIMTQGPGQIRAMVIDSGNPVISGPDGAKLDLALSQLDLLVAVDLVQRESHRHAHWLLPAVHWLERDDLLALTSTFHDEPFLQYGIRAVDPPPDTREEWWIFVQLAIAMGKPLFGVRGLNRVIKSSRGLARLTRRPALAFGPHWIDRLMVAMSRKVNGRKLKWRDLMTHEHGLVLGPREFGHFKDALRTSDKKVHLAPPEFLARVRELLALPRPASPEGFPFQLGNRRNRHSMNSWLNELPGLHPAGKQSTVLINPSDAVDLGIREGDQVRVFSEVGSIELVAEISERPRSGLVIIDHGWGSRVYDPRGASAPVAHGVNRNLLVSGDAVDPLSHTPELSSAYVGIARA